ncbi:MAG: hypothetical protein R8J84_07350 [Mariprofundales bacterium]
MEMFKYQAEYELYLKKKRVVTRDKTVDAVQLNVAFLDSVSEHLGINLTPRVLGSNEDIEAFVTQLAKSGKIPARKIKNYRAAMQHYVDMVNGR